MNPNDIVEAGLADGDTVRLVTDFDGDDVARSLGGLKLVAYKLPRGTIEG